MMPRTVYKTVGKDDIDHGVKVRAYEDERARGRVHLDLQEFLRMTEVHYKCVPVVVDGKETMTVAEAIVAWKD
jgi:hypothetical protein